MTASTDTRTLTAVKINAGNDRNGNPRRGWIILSTDDNGYPGIVDFCDEGYEGSAAVTGKGYSRKLADAPELAVTPGEYRDLMKRYGD